MTGEVVIERRFQGPPDSANGGYTCGRLAAFVEADVVAVSLRSPPPLERALAVEARDGGAVLLDGGAVVAEAVPASLDLDVPGPVDLEAARAAAERYPFRDPDLHAFPRCFVCGPERREGDGLRITCGPVAGRAGVYASPWTPPGEGVVPPEIAWAALDCPTAVPVANPGSTPPIVLARMTARVRSHVEAGRPHVLQSWAIGRDGRKREAGSALYAADGRLLGVASALWIELRA